MTTLSGPGGLVDVSVSNPVLRFEQDVWLFEGNLVKIRHDARQQRNFSGLSEELRRAVGA
ncbi:hypothetical protein PIIN_11240 [Serendipita indica DSM 11827]|uniref:Uncharacterized protein n=1 Tax=Serendipita indica (strain DSM 11827) TaxID=1109443 RepID=G4U119_SERID|nr:hypothetical protein PIIN_11240 [Serendipita indica DSM 11827]